MNRNRRKLLTAMTLGGGTVAATRIPDQWAKPVVETVALPAHAQTTVVDCDEAGGANPTIFETPGSFSFVVPAGVTVLTVELFGADGGLADFEAGEGGEGATVFISALPVTPCESLTVCVGEPGEAGAESTGGASGFSSCGLGGAEGGEGFGELAGGGGGGGAATALFRGAELLGVAGGGGGAGGSGNASLGPDGAGGCSGSSGGSGLGEGQSGESGSLDGQGGGGGGGGGLDGGSGGSAGNPSGPGFGGTCGGSAAIVVTPGTSAGGADGGRVEVSWA